jgi:circadian clock protein KaiC
LLQIHSSRPTLLGLEMHLVRIHKLIEEFQPATVVLDPISNFMAAGNKLDAAAMLLRLIDYLKSRQVTSMFTHLTSGGETADATDIGVSSLTDTWILMRHTETGGERKRGLHVLKSRGMQHSNQVREYHITSQGLRIDEGKATRKRK